MQKMSVVLGRRLWETAGTPEIDTRRLTVSIGIAMGITEEIRAQHDAWQEKGLRAVSPLAVQMYMPNAPAAAVGLERHAKAGIVSPVMADASGGAAIGQAWRQLVLGEADIAICGGVETDDRGGARRGVLAGGVVVDEQRRSDRRLPPVRQGSRRHGAR